MKRLLMTFLLVGGAFAFASCGDDGDCTTCTILTVETTYCDNGDGTVTQTTAGQETTVTGDYDAIIEAAALVAECD